ncbi:MAG: hypothetical protein QOF83_231 [Solirubrobacteraceae bacterium]|nr:hypothetical protein [Solirubrobacteraceae bacterium]
MLSEPRRLVVVPRPKLRLPRSRPPSGLPWILGVVLCFAVTWALLIPPWQSPDEIQHFAYAQTLVEDHALPGLAGRSATASSQAAADGAVGATRGAFAPAPAPPSWIPADAAAYDAAAPHMLRTDGGGPNPAQPNPPLFYAYSDIGYLLSGSASAFSQLDTMRLFSALLVVVNALGGWLLAGEALGRRRPAQLTAAAVCGLLPMETFIGASVNPDSLMVTLWTLALWMGTRVINRRAPVRDVIALCALTAAAILTKGTSYALVPPTVLAVAIGWWRRPRVERRQALLALLPAGLVLVVPVIGWLSVAHANGQAGVNSFVGGIHATSFNVRQFLSYVWQYYLPRLPWMYPFRVTGGLGVYDTWIREGIGDFGWLVVPLPKWVYMASAAVVGGLAVGAVAVVARIRNRLRLALVAFYGLAVISLFGGLHLYEYRSVIGGNGALLQGRYALPVVGVLATIIGLFVVRTPPRLRAAALGLVVVCLLGLQAISLSALIGAYYL